MLKKMEDAPQGSFFSAPGNPYHLLKVAFRSLSHSVIGTRQFLPKYWSYFVQQRNRFAISKRRHLVVATPGYVLRHSPGVRSFSEYRKLVQGSLVQL